MQLVSNLSLLMGKFRFNIQDVHEKTGLARRTISTLYNDKATRIDFSTIEKLCQLFGCGIEQLFVLCNDETQQVHITIKENTQ
ncbi:MAG: helix-turn-helix transcriptional regulator [Treponema sp.]|nr:helix-turn-helix transcriptional regulator [Treponema sp.]